VTEINREKNRVRLKTVCVNQRGEEVLGGEALVMPSRLPVRYERVADPAALLTLWALGPWAWAAQGAAMMGMLGLSAIALTTPRVGRVGR
jgi:hypothetical protein